MQPHVTVAIPVFNGGKFIGRAVASVLAQTYEPLTVLVIDNRSTDETERVLSGFNDERLVVRRFENHVPLASNWDRAIQASTGDLVMVMSADNSMLPGALAALVKAIEADPEYGMAIGRVQLEVAPGHRRVSLSPSHELAGGAIDDLEAHLLKRGYNFSINAVLFRRDLPGLYFARDSGHGCDVDLLLRLGQAGVKAVGIEAPIHKWLDHPDTLSSKKYDAVWEALMTAYLGARETSRRSADYDDRLGKMLVWECMRLLQRGERDAARRRRSQFGPTTSWFWRWMAWTMTTVPGAYQVPQAARWLTARHM